MVRNAKRSKRSKRSDQGGKHFRQAVGDQDVCETIAHVWGFDRRRADVFRAIMGSELGITNIRDTLGELVKRGLDSYEAETKTKLLPQGDKSNESG